MKKLLEPMDLSGLSTCSLESRKSKVDRGDFGRPWVPGGALSAFLQGLPNILAAKDLRTVAAAIVEAHRQENQVVLAMGAHVIKVGLNPVVIDLMERGLVTAIALNGAGIIHDAEIALVGRTSEEVQDGLDRGDFGMARETAAFLNQALARADKRAEGLGFAVGAEILEGKLPFAGDSMLAAAARLGIPATVHVAIGTDILHMHPGFNAGAAGMATHLDFRRFCAVVARLDGGVYMNVGSAVILPEVFLKALTLVRNLGHKVYNFTAVNMDFLRHYRPTTNVVCRPTSKAGKGYTLVGHHEIMLPLLAAAVVEMLNGEA